MLAMKKIQSDEIFLQGGYIFYLYRSIVDAAAKHLGGIDILILNAAYSPPPTVFTEYKNPVSDDVISCIT